MAFASLAKSWIQTRKVWYETEAMAILWIGKRKDS